MAGEAILIIEDMPTNLKLEKLLLLAEGYEVRTAIDVKKALNILENFTPQLIIMDFQLPDKHMLTREIRINLKFKDILMIALTAFTMTGDEEKEAGYDGYISKPISVIDFPKQIAKFLLKKSFFPCKISVSEQLYRQLVELSPEAIFIKQGDKFVYANNSALKLLNASSLEELSTRSFYDVFMPDTKKIIEQYIQDNQDKIFTPLEGKVITLNGKAIDVEIIISSFFYAEQPVTYIIMRDITERKRSMLYLEIQYAIAWILAESATLSAATNKILKIICERLQWDCAAIWAVDKQSNVLRCARTWQMPQIESNIFLRESQDTQLMPGEDLVGMVWQERKTIWRTDIYNDIEFLHRRSVIALELHTAVAFPIIYEDKVLGIINFFSKKNIPFDHTLLLCFESIGHQVGLFLIRKHMEKQMLYLAEHDVLTGLPNRSLLEQYLSTAIINAKENAQKIAVLFLDLDNFKYINDSMGHQVGDKVLKEISETLAHCLRPQDSISRLGGDEFIIILTNIHNKEEVIAIVGRLQNQLSDLTTIKGENFFITTSVGISIYPTDGTTAQELIKSADIAMYAAKGKGRNGFLFCTYEMTGKAEKRGMIQNNLSQALNNEELILYYQPKIEIATQKVVGMEALIRWKKDGAILLPENFITEIEDSNIIIPIGEWALKTAFEQNKTWQSMGLPPITMSVNLSVRNLNKKLLQDMKKILTEIKLFPGSFEIELTESALMENVENNIQILRSLKEMGLKISIDDFGTGYSSLSYLKRFPIDIIKIDKIFIRDIATDVDDAAITTAIIAMAHSLNFKVIAEGVETEAQLKFLCEHGCDEVQGYYFSRPLTVAEATNFIKNAKIFWSFEQ